VSKIREAAIDEICVSMVIGLLVWTT